MSVINDFYKTKQWNITSSFPCRNNLLADLKKLQKQNLYTHNTVSKEKVIQVYGKCLISMFHIKLPRCTEMYPYMKMIHVIRQWTSGWWHLAASDESLSCWTLHCKKNLTLNKPFIEETFTAFLRRRPSALKLSL